MFGKLLHFPQNSPLDPNTSILLLGLPIVSLAFNFQLLQEQYTVGSSSLPLRSGHGDLLVSE